MNEDKIIQKLMEHDDRFDRIESQMDGLMTKVDGDKITAVLEQVVTMVKKIQEDHVFTVELYKRLQAQIDKNEADMREQKQEIQKIKLQMQIA